MRKGRRRLKISSASTGISRIVYPLLCGFASTIIGLGLWVSLSEVQPFLTGATDPVQNIVAISHGIGGPGIAAGSHQAVLLDCARAISLRATPRVTELPAENQAAVAPTCGRIAEDVIAVTPTNSFAHFVEGAAAVVATDWAGFNEQLYLSYLTGPNELWVAEWRALLVEDSLLHIEERLIAHHNADLIMLASNERGLATIAILYRRNMFFRARIEQLVENLDPSIQRRFLRYIRNNLG